MSRAALKRALGIVLMRDRGTKHRHHGIADELFDKPVISRDRVAKHLEQSILECAHLLGVEPLGEAS